MIGQKSEKSYITFLCSYFSCWYNIFLRAQPVLNLESRNMSAHFWSGINLDFFSSWDRLHNKQMQKVWRFFSTALCLYYLTGFVFSRNMVIRLNAPSHILCSNVHARGAGYGTAGEQTLVPWLCTGARGYPPWTWMTVHPTCFAFCVVQPVWSDLLPAPSFLWVALPD